MASPAPADLFLSSLTVNESDVIGVPVGTLATLAADGTLLPSTGLTYAFVNGEGAEDNARFRLVNGQLQAAEVLDRESRSQLRVRIRVTDASARSAEKAFTILVNDLPNPVATLLPTPALVWGEAAGELNLGSFFDDPLSTGLVATFQLAPVLLANNTLVAPGAGRVRVLLYDQSGLGAPLTTSNLQAYVAANRYSGTFLHRSVPGFVLQGGGFNLVESATGGQIAAVTTFPAVRNEYSPLRSNIRGTIAMAKLGSDPNSATSQWFWSLADNSAILNPQNGGFTVFGRVLDSTDLATLDALAALPVTNQSLTLGGVFAELPLSNRQLRIDNLLRFSGITITQQPELAYAVIGNSAPDLLEATLEGTRLRLRSLANRSQEVSLTLRATNLLGETLERTLRVQVNRKPTNQATIRSLSDAPGNASPTLQRPTLTGSLASPLQPDERVRLFADGSPLGLATPTPGGLGWRYQPDADLAPGPDGTVLLEARLESVDGVPGASSAPWALDLASVARLAAPGAELLQVADSRPLVIQPTALGTWGPGFSAWNAGSLSASGQWLPGTGQTVPIAGLRRYGISVRGGPQSQITLDLGDGDHAFFLHDSWTPQAGELSASRDSQGRQTAPRFDQLATIRMGQASGAGATRVVDLTSPDFLIGPLTVVAGDTVGSREVIWGSAADDTVIGGAADTVIFGSAGRNTYHLGSGADRLQYVAGTGANDQVRGFQPAFDRLELWGLPPGTSPDLTLQVAGADTLLTWQSNRLTFRDLTLPPLAPGTLPSWIVVM